MSRLTFLALSLALAASAAVLAQATVVGDWDLTFTTPQGSNTVTVKFEQVGEQVTSNLTSPLGSVQLSGTETPEGDVAMAGSVDIQGLKLELGLRAKLAGETLSGTVAFGPIGDFPFTGKRSERKPLADGVPQVEQLPPGESASISGKWNITLVANAGQFPLSATFDQQGEQVTGTVSSPFGDAPATGTMIDNNLRLEFSVPAPLGAVNVVMTGQLGANGLVGKATFPGMGETDWTGIRESQ